MPHEAQIQKPIHYAMQSSNDNLSSKYHKADEEYKILLVDA